MSTIDQPERRQHERFLLAPMYSDVTVQRVEDLSIDRLGGHAYDISETGVRIELDEALEVGQGVALYMSLPGEDAPVFVAADVVWVNDELDDPGPRRMALRFTDFLIETERERLLAYLANTASKRAA